MTQQHSFQRLTRDKTIRESPTFAVYRTALDGWEPLSSTAVAVEPPITPYRFAYSKRMSGAIVREWNT